MRCVHWLGIIRAPNAVKLTYGFSAGARPPAFTPGMHAPPTVGPWACPKLSKSIPRVADADFCLLVRPGVSKASHQGCSPPLAVTASGQGRPGVPRGGSQDLGGMAAELPSWLWPASRPQGWAPPLAGSARRAQGGTRPHQARTGVGPFSQ